MSKIYRHDQVPKRAKNSILCQLKKLVKRYGLKEVRLVIGKYFQKEIEQIQLEKEIQIAEERLGKLKEKKK